MCFILEGMSARLAGTDHIQETCVLGRKVCKRLHGGPEPACWRCLLCPKPTLLEPQNVTLYGNQFVEDVISLDEFLLGLDKSLIQHSWYLMRGEPVTAMKDSGRDWSIVSTSQEQQGLFPTPEAKRRAWNRFYSVVCRENTVLLTPCFCASSLQDTQRIKPWGFLFVFVVWLRVFVHSPGCPELTL